MVLLYPWCFCTSDTATPPRRGCGFHCRRLGCWCGWAMGNGRRATSDGAVGVVVGGVATRPRRRAAGAAFTAAATCVGVAVRRAAGGGSRGMGVVGMALWV